MSMSMPKNPLQRTTEEVVTMALSQLGYKSWTNGHYMHEFNQALYGFIPEAAYQKALMADMLSAQKRMEAEAKK